MKHLTITLLILLISGSLFADDNEQSGDKTITLSCKNNFTEEYDFVSGEVESKKINDGSKGLQFNKQKREVIFGNNIFRGFVINAELWSGIDAKWHEWGTEIFWNIYDSDLGGRRWHLTIDTISGNLDYRFFSDSEDSLFLHRYSNYTCKKSDKLF